MPQITPADSHELAWAAGFFDGEGSFYLSNNGYRGRTYPRSSIHQNDAEVLERFAAAVGVGRISRIAKPHTNGSHIAVFHQWQTWGILQVDHVIDVLWPWLGSVKRAQAERVRKGTFS